MTRRALLHDLEEKLRATLKELELSKTLTNQLLQEREDSEVEVKNIIDKNTKLKNELAELHSQNMDLVDQNEHLQQIVAGFHQCSDTHEHALHRISELGNELCEARRSICHLESLQDSKQAMNTLSQYDKLVGSVHNVVSDKPTVTIDLTGEDSSSKCHLLTSHKNIKKYIKINRMIRKFHKNLKKINVYKINISLRKDRVSLLNELKNCNNKIDLSRTKYDIDTYQLREELMCREKMLKDIFANYESTQKQLSERILEASELVDMVRYNAERYESLTNNFSCSCACTLPPPEPTSPTMLPPPEPVLAPLPLPIVAQPVVSDVGIMHRNSSHCKKTVYMFSDRFGQGYGDLLGRYSQHNITNYCLPGSSYSNLTNKISSTELNSKSSVILLYGESLTVKKKEIEAGVKLMLELHQKTSCKFIICALPYSNSLTNEQNRHIHNLNMFMYNITRQHRDSIVYFDTNLFIKSFILTKEVMYLPLSFKRQIASLLAFNLSQHSGTHTLTKTDICNVSNFNLNYKVGQQVGYMN